MATKASERAQKWWNERHQRNATQNDIERGILLSQQVESDIAQTLAEYEAATIERCAQIAEQPIARLRESMQQAVSANRPVVRECRQSDIETLERAAAAIRSMGG